MADGCYARVNAEMVRSGRFEQQIVSVVGKFTTPPDAGGLVTFACADGGTVRLDTQHAELPSTDLHGNGPPFEVVGQCVGGDLVAMFVTRELTADMDLEVYNKMIAVQQNPKFAHYFAPAAANNDMATN